MVEPLASPYLAALALRPLIFDGAMGTQLQELELAGRLLAADFAGKPGCNDYLSLTRPDIVTQVHLAYLEAGADVVETNTFGSTRPKLGEYGIGEQLRSLNLAAVRVAREACALFATPARPRFVAGAMGPTGYLPSSDDPVLGSVGFEELAGFYREQAEALIEGGCDLLLVETGQDILEVKAAIAGAHDAFVRLNYRLPLQVQVTLDLAGRMLLGTDIDAVLAILTALPVEVIGLNCSTGPEQMREAVRRMGECSRLPVSIMPNAGIPGNVAGKAVYPLDPLAFAKQLADFVREYGVAVVGGCCGTTPEHIRQLSLAMNAVVPRDRKSYFVPHLASAFRAVALDQLPRPLIVGERINAQGSQKTKALLLADDYDGILTVGRNQCEAGAHVLDVCVALTERADEAAQLRMVVKKLSSGVEAPLCIDSTDPSAIRAALENYPGRAIINSINLERGRQRIADIVPLAVRHGAVLIALTIDERGMAKTAERKLAIAQRIHRIVTQEYQLPPHALIFDPLTFTLATGEAEYQTAARDTIEGIKAIKHGLPGVYTILGISNVSFGLATSTRRVLNSIFLYHCIQAGLDLAIMHPAHLVPYAEIPLEQRELAEDLIFYRRPAALERYIAHFEHGPVPVLAVTAPTDPVEQLSLADQIRWQILQRKKDKIAVLLAEALQNSTPLEILNSILLPAMREVGDKFAAGELILPFVLQSAEVMKKAIIYLTPFFDRQAGVAKGRVVLP
ncbi:MAG: homocysteine S-methyltransferase family protein, partial [Cyanobacteria bacterium NC_groundwater_1444_Ag_S-0.65um_54_12]|nr:homocysteine S-methyltransferase family protein [Cyanobacteria bacterium NC_groundwater_1444_Ag_S-0.65um_54_12]